MLTESRVLVSGTAWKNNAAVHKVLRLLPKGCTVMYARHSGAAEAANGYAEDLLQHILIVNDDPDIIMQHGQPQVVMVFGVVGCDHAPYESRLIEAAKRHQVRTVHLCVS